MPGPVKIYDRPAPRGLPPAVIALIVLVLLVAGYFLFRTFYHPAAAQQSSASSIRVQTAFWREGTSYEWSDHSSRNR